MKSYLIVYNKTTSSSIEVYEKRLKSLFQTYYREIPAISSKKINNYICMNFSNEGFNFQNNIPSYFLGYSGYVNGESDILLSMLKRNKDEFIRNLSGVFSLAFVDEKDNSVNVWNNITGAEPVYWSETDDYIIVGNKLLMVHLFSTNSNKPDYSIENMTSFINNGYYADGLLPYKNVNILPIGSKLVIKDNSISILNYTLKEDEYYKESPTNNTYDELTDIFVDSFRGLDKDTEINLGLTGGKDSRLIIAALYHSKVDFTTFTNGFDSTLDVIAAKQISDILGIKHTTKQPMKQRETHINIDLFDRLQKSIRVYEGLLFGYEDVIFNNSFSHNQIIIGGQGGELLRGGFARNFNIENKAELTSLIEKLFFSFNQYINKESAENYMERFNKYIDYYLQYMSYNDLINKFYLDYRTGRWSGASKPAYSFNSVMYAPFFDNKLINRVSSVKTSYGSSELIIFNMLKRLAPKLLDIPFANDRWNFERKNPKSKYDIDGWIQRKPFESLNLRASFNWRRNLFANFKDELYDIIFQEKSTNLFNIVDKGKVQKIFNLKDSTKYDYFLWSLVTISALISNEWIEGESNNNITRIILPEQNNRKLNVLSAIKKVDSNNLSQINKKISITHVDELTSKISWNNFNKKVDRLYIQLFDNGFRNPPSTKYNNICNIEMCSKVRFVFEYEKEIKDKINVDIFIMTYDWNKRINNYRFNKDLVSSSEFLDVIVNLNETEKYFKVAFKISDGPDKGYIFINQMRVEYYN